MRKDKQDRGPSLPMRALMLVAELMPGLFRPVTLVLSVVTVALAWAVVGFAMFVFSMGAVLTAFFIGGGGMILYWTALCWIFYGGACYPVEGLAEMDSRQWFIFMFLNAAPIGAAWWLLSRAA